MPINITYLMNSVSITIIYHYYLKLYSHFKYLLPSSYIITSVQVTHEHPINSSNYSILTHYLNSNNINPHNFMYSDSLVF